MSYDVQAGGDWHNYTYNLSAFFTDFGAQPSHWDGRDRFEVADEIDEALRLIAAEDLPRLRRKYTPENGWGSVDGAIQWLGQVRDSCRYEPPRTVTVT